MNHSQLTRTNKKYTMMVAFLLNIGVIATSKQICLLIFSYSDMSHLIESSSK